MHRLFATVVAPVVEALAPSTMVEVGAGAGRLTRPILSSPGAAATTLHAVDPRPAFDAEEIGDGRLVLHVGRSHAVLPEIGAVDLAVLDGDPNWYTVHRELELLAAAARAAERPPPVVLVHNVHWPFGRRDGYHDPAAVPGDARRPFVEAGVLPGRLQPAADGLRLVPFVAAAEHGERNGVMTAVDDFVAGDADDWRVVDLPGFHGAAVVVAGEASRANVALRGLGTVLRGRVTLRHAARRVEHGRVEALLAAQAASPVVVERLEARLAAAGEELDAARAERAAAQERETAAGEALAAAERRVGELEALAAELGDRAVELEAQAVDPERERAMHEAAQWRIEVLERDLAARDAERREAVAARDEQSRAAVEASVRLARALDDLRTAHDGLARAQKEAAALRDDGAGKDAELGELAERLRLLGGRASHLEEALGAAQAEAREAHAHALVLDERVRARLEHEAEVADRVRAAAASHSWRIGHALVRAARTLTFRRTVKSEGALEVALQAIERPELSEGGARASEIAPADRTKTGNVSDLPARAHGNENPTVRRA